MDIEKLVSEFNTKCRLLGKNEKLCILEDKVFFNIRLADTEIVNIPDFVYGIYSKNKDEYVNENIIINRINKVYSKYSNNNLHIMENNIYSNSSRKIVDENEIVKEIKFGSKIKYIHESYFKGFTSLEYISDFSELEYLGTYSIFYGCSSLKRKPKLPKSLNVGWVFTSYVGTQFRVK